MNVYIYFEEANTGRARKEGFSETAIPPRTASQTTIFSRSGGGRTIPSLFRPIKWSDTTIAEPYPIYGAQAVVVPGTVSKLQHRSESLVL